MLSHKLVSATRTLFKLLPFAITLWMEVWKHGSLLVLLLLLIFLAPNYILLVSNNIVRLRDQTFLPSNNSSIGTIHQPLNSPSTHSTLTVSSALSAVSIVRLCRLQSSGPLSPSASSFFKDGRLFLGERLWGPEHNHFLFTVTQIRHGLRNPKTVTTDSFF